MKNHPLKRVRSQELSLWQSIVSQYVLDHQDTVNVAAGVQENPMVQAVNQHVSNAFTEEYHQELKIPETVPLNAPVPDINVYLSELGLSIARAKVRNDETLEEELTKTYRKFSDKDPGFLTCATTYARYFAKYKGILKYNSWQTTGNIDYGVISYKVPDNAKIAIIGDWGTGMEDASCLLNALLNYHKPEVIIHLGDIYYSGTPEECLNNYSGIFDDAFRDYGKRLPVFTIPGNHDYYAFGYGYYEMVKKINAFLPSAVQDASFFCLRTRDNGWQFLGMDTGYDDANPANQFNTYYAGPNLHPSEITWHKDKLDRFKGSTIMLSHHQLFSHHDKINGSLSVYGSYPNLNKYILDVFSPYFNGKIAGWLWGHEHNQVIYKDGLFGLPKGRLTGASAYQEISSEDPYKVNYKNVPIDGRYKLGKSQGYFNHGYAIIDLSVRKKPSDGVEVSYYEYPSWGETAPNPIPSKPVFMMREIMQPVTVPIVQPVKYDQQVHINLENGLEYIGGVNKSWQYYPTVGSSPVKLKIKGGKGNIRSGDLVQIQSQEKGIGSYNLLGAWKTPALYYYKSGYDEEYWYINKVTGTTGEEINDGDAVYFINNKYKGQYLAPLVQVAYPGVISLTTDARVPGCWYLKVC